MKCARGGVSAECVVDRVAALADAGDIAPPSPELCILAGLIITLCKNKPEKVGEIVHGVRDFVDAHQKLGAVIRLRGAEYDGDVLRSMAQAAAWLERIEPFLNMMVRR